MSEKKPEPRIGDIDVEIGDNSRVDHVGHVINQAPEPNFVVISESAATLPDGTYERRTVFEVQAPYVVPNVTIEAIADDIINFGVLPTFSIVFNSREGKVAPTAWHAKFSNASGRYELRLVTKAETPVRYGVVWQ